MQVRSLPWPQEIESSYTEGELAPLKGISALKGSQPSREDT